MHKNHPTIPGHLIKHKIGEGGMSVVYLAEQQSLHREVALKVMRPVVSEESHSTERFVHEAKTIAKLYHPNIMSIYDVGHLPDGTLYYAMPYLTHGDLNSVHWVDDEHIKEVFAALCDGLAFAHQHGVVHRDLKPENILFDAFGHPQIADFGIALSDHHKKWTKDNSIVGSLNYISPEQAQSQTVDARSDIYALGAMLYEVVSGQPVFKEKEELALMLAHVSETPKPLVKNKQHWQGVINQCLEKQPNNRFQDAETLKQAILDVNSNHIETQNRAAIQAKPIWLKVTAITAIVLALTIGYFYTPDPQNTATEQPTAESQFIGASHTQDKNQAIDYIELNPNNPHPSLDQLQSIFQSSWTPEQAQSHWDALLFHLQTQPEHGTAVAKTYIEQLSQSGMDAIDGAEYNTAYEWQQLLKSIASKLHESEQKTLAQHADLALNHFDQHVSTHRQQINNTDQKKQMADIWPQAETTINIEPKDKPHPLDLSTTAVAGFAHLAITQTEVTVKQFRAFANATAIESVRCKNKSSSSLRFSSKTWSNPGFSQKNNHPVVCVSWQQAVDFAEWLSNKTGHKYRLPNAQEWLAAQSQKPTACGQHNVAGTETQHLKIKHERYPCQDGYIQTAPVKSYNSPNAVFGMQGNVREWLQGCKKKNKIQSLFSKSSQCDSHPTIGQSWLSDQQDAGDVSYEKSNQAWTHIGFRLIREL